MTPGTPQFLPLVEPHEKWRPVAIAVNYALSPYSVVYRPTVAPANPTEGQTYYDAAGHVMKTWDGSAWRLHW